MNSRLTCWPLNRVAKKHLPPLSQFFFFSLHTKISISKDAMLR